MFDLLGICKTKEQIDSGFLANVSFPGYSMHSAPSKSSAGGVALYIKSSLNYKLREDLKFTNDGFEMIGVEIINSKTETSCAAVLIGIQTLMFKSLLILLIVYFRLLQRKTNMFSFQEILI